MHDTGTSVTGPILEELGRLPVFAGLPADELRSLTAGASIRTYEPERVIWLAGATPTAVYVVLSGEVKIVRAAEGRQHVIHRGRGGEMLGEVPLFAGGGYPATAIAVSRSRCVVIPRERLEDALARHPGIASLLLAHLARRVRLLVDRLDERSGLGVRGRLVRVLVEAAGGRDGHWFSLGRTQSELAEELGTVREVVVRALSEMRTSGALESDGRGRYRILNTALLDDRDR